MLHVDSNTLKDSRNISTNNDARDVKVDNTVIKEKTKEDIVLFIGQDDSGNTFDEYLPMIEHFYDCTVAF